jgi:Cu/Ag efflux protein CusF
MRIALAGMAAGVVLMGTAAYAQKPVSKTEALEAKATIEAIDQGARLLTLKGEDGEVETLQAGPEIKRFNELKVGDTVTFRYYESVVYRVRKPGDPAPATGSADPAIVPGSGPRPGGTAALQQTATVTVKAIDAKVPSVTVVNEKGRTSSHRIEDANNIKGLKVGDKVEITYTEAVLITVK